MENGIGVECRGGGGVSMRVQAMLGLSEQVALRPRPQTSVGVSHVGVLVRRPSLSHLSRWKGTENSGL